MTEHDLILFGATGFTGGLVAEHLARHVGRDGAPPTRWAIAGRNADALAAVRERLATIDPRLAELDLLHADATDPASLQRVAESTRVVATTVGPFINYGEGLVAACAAAGTDYVDLTGEPEFVDTMWVRYHEQAERSGARIVHSCGFDSIPHDLGTLFTVERLPAGEPLTVEEFVQVGATFSGGTYHSLIHGLSRARPTMAAATQRRRLEPRSGSRRPRAIRTPLRRNPTGEGWALTAPTIDVDTVLRSARALDRYGPEFRYGLSFVTRRAAGAAAVAGGFAALTVLAQVPPVRDALLRLRDPGDGPDASRRERSWFTARFAGRVGSEPEPRVVCEVRGGDPGYDETAKMLAQSALCLAHDELPETRGMVTPAVAMGQALIDRLQGVGIAFEQIAGSMTDLRADGHAAIDWAADYLERVGELPVLAQVAPGEIRARLPAHPPEDPEPFSAVLRDIDEIIVPGTTHWQHPRYFAYFASASTPPAILGELIAATLNSVAFLWRTAPASTELEGLIADWVAELIGLPAGWHGHIEDSASTATLAAAIAARRATGRELLVCSEQAHSSVAKAGQMLGMSVRTVPTDAAFRLDPAALGDLAGAAMVVATVGTTASTSVDPVPAIADACERAGAWLHVDAAYAGSAMVCPELRPAFDGVQRADSLVLNPHKWMLVGNDCSLLYSRRPDDLRAAFSLVPEYLRTPDAEDALSLSEYGPALGRRFRSLKLWAVLRCYGRSGLQAHIRSGITLAQRFESLVAAEPGWELCAPRTFSVVCFRAPGDDARNQELLRQVNASGEIFISHAVLGGRYVLRLAVGGMLTGEQDIDRAWAVLRRSASAL